MSAVKVQVEDPQVHHNLQLVLSIFHRMQKIKEPIPSLSVHINKKTGEFKSSEKASRAKDWTHIRIQLVREKEGYAFEFFGENRDTFNIDELSSQSQRVLNDTLKTLTSTVHRLKKQSSIKLIRRIGSVDFELLPDWTKDEEILKTAWHRIDRLQAERMLREKEPGTYLFRRDTYTEILEKQLRLAHHYPIACITLTFLDRSGKLIEKTLVKKNGGWIVYDDDPGLSAKAHASLRDLLRGHLKFPLR